MEVKGISEMTMAEIAAMTDEEIDAYMKRLDELEEQAGGAFVTKPPKQ